MRTTLYIFSILWLVAGLVILVLSTTLEPVPLLQLLQTAPAVDGTEAHPVFGNLETFLILLAGAVWVLVFCVPALFLAAIGSMLGRLDRLGKTHVPDALPRQPAAPAKKRVFAEKVEPHIGRV